MEPAKSILVVDDHLVSRMTLVNQLTEIGFACEGAVNGFEGIVTAKKNQPDVVIMDVMMPEMDGFEACRVLKSSPETLHIPVLLISALDNKPSRIKGLEAGSNDFMSKPIDMYELQLRIRNMLRVRQNEEFLTYYNQMLEAQITRNTAQLKTTLIESINRLALAAEFRDGYTGSHIKRMSSYTRHMAVTLGLSEDDAETMYYASPMHDIGKIGISDTILMKPGPLTQSETDMMKKHPTIGGHLLEGSDSPIISSARNFALTHHERWDGSGYPAGLRGDEIPIEGRILNIVDQYDAIRSKRPYKPRLRHEEALDIIINGDDRTSPAHFDPRMLEAFADTSDEFDRIYMDTKAEGYLKSLDRYHA